MGHNSPNSAISSAFGFHTTQKVVEGISHEQVGHRKRSGGKVKFAKTLTKKLIVHSLLVTMRLRVTFSNKAGSGSIEAYSSSMCRRLGDQ